MQRRRCAAMLDHRGCNDDAAHNDHILALITAAHAELLPAPAPSSPRYRTPRQRPSPTNNRSFSFLLSQWTLRLTRRHKSLSLEERPCAISAFCCQRRALSI